MLPGSRVAEVTGSTVSRTDSPNPYILAYNRDRRPPGIFNGRQGKALLDTSLYGQKVVRHCDIIPRQIQRRLRGNRYVSASNLRQQVLKTSSREFLLRSAPTIGQLIEHTSSASNRIFNKHANSPCVSTLEMGQIEQSARISVHQEYTATVASGQYGTVPRLKPDDTIRMMYKNFSSLSLFSI
jgi:hypothetical protein